MEADSNVSPSETQKIYTRIFKSLMNYFHFLSSKYDSIFWAYLKKSEETCETNRLIMEQPALQLSLLLLGVYRVFENHSALATIIAVT
jgi:hypothetical protein